MKTMNTPKLYLPSIINTTEKKSLGLKALQRQATFSSFSKQNQVSRQRINAQKNKKTAAAVDHAFDTPINDEHVLFNLPVTQSWLKQFVLSLVFDGKASFRGVQKSMHSLLDHHCSIGSIFNIVHSLIPKATALTTGQDLSRIKMGANDELFQHHKPVLTGVDLQSLYCYLLAKEKQCDGETWAVHLLDLEKQQFNPDRVIADLAQGLRAGLKIVYPHTPCDIDHFHILRDLFALRRSFRNHLKSAISYHTALAKKIEKAQQLGRCHKDTDKLEPAQVREETLRYLSSAIDTLVNWIDHDILNKAGPAPAIRRELFNFVLAELRKLENIHPQQLRAMCIALDNQRERLLGFSDVLNDKFKTLALQFSLPLEIIWQFCELQRCKHSGDRYAVRSAPLQVKLGDALYYDVEDAVIVAMNDTERTSSMVENLNSRLRPYFFLRKEIGHGYLHLLQFYLNHTPFLRSEHPDRVGKTPAELLTSEKQVHWLELLDFKRFKRAA